MWAKIRGIVVGSVKRGSAIGKRRVLGSVLFARDGIEKPEHSTRIRMGRQVRTGGLPGCRFGSRNDWGRPTRSIYVSEAVRLRSVCHKASPPSFPHCRFRFLGPPGFGGTTKVTKGDRGLGSFDYEEGKGVGSLVDVECIKIKRGKFSAI